jgi:hypothetical protein
MRRQKKSTLYRLVIKGRSMKGFETSHPQLNVNYTANVLAKIGILKYNEVTL